ncbi:hypothetical protein I552_1762 [Mycobacterium xenopi 3993]|nr:hypothetical protein I552_1762 [Mycobacterium xenopi 3993]
MNQRGLRVVREFDPTPITTLLCDADDNLFPSEKPAFAASVEVINHFLARFGVTAPFTAEELRRQAVGKNFRSTAIELATQSGVPMEPTLADGRPGAVVASSFDVAAGRALGAEELEEWVRRERDHVTAHLAATLRPDPQVLAPLQASPRGMHWRRSAPAPPRASTRVSPPPASTHSFQRHRASARKTPFRCRPASQTPPSTCIPAKYWTSPPTMAWPLKTRCPASPPRSRPATSPSVT